MFNSDDMLNSGQIYGTCFWKFYFKILKFQKMNKVKSKFALLNIWFMAKHPQSAHGDEFLDNRNKSMNNNNKLQLTKKKCFQHIISTIRYFLTFSTIFSTYFIKIFQVENILFECKKLSKHSKVVTFFIEY